MGKSFFILLLLLLFIVLGFLTLQVLKLINYSASHNW